MHLRRIGLLTIIMAVAYSAPEVAWSEKKEATKTFPPVGSECGPLSDDPPWEEGEPDYYGEGYRKWCEFPDGTLWVCKEGLLICKRIERIVEAGSRRATSATGAQEAITQTNALEVPSHMNLERISGAVLALHWRDNSQVEDGFIIEAMTPKEVFGVSTKIWKRIATVRDTRPEKVRGMGDRSYRLHDLVAGQKYCFRVQAFKGTIKSNSGQQICAIA